MPRLVFRHFGRQRRARPHDGHGTLDDVEKLGQLVEAELAQDSPERVDARVVLHLERLSAGLVQRHELFLAFFGVDVHAAELVHREFLAVLADAGLFEDDGTLGIADFDGECTEQEQRRQQEDAAGGADQVERALDKVPVAYFVRMLPDF